MTHTHSRTAWGALVATLVIGYSLFGAPDLSELAPGASRAWAQGAGHCFDRPTADSSTFCANTKFVKSAIAASTISAGGTSGQIQYNNAGALGGFTASGDAGINTASGVVTITPNAVTNAKLATATANTVKGSATSTAAADLAVPSCSTAASVLQWLSGTGFQCATNGSITVASGTITLSTTPISSATCISVQSAAATGAAATDTLMANPNADPTSTTGYIPLTTGMLAIFTWPSTNTVNFRVCNNTLATITPVALPLNWRVVR